MITSTEVRHYTGRENSKCLHILYYEKEKKVNAKTLYAGTLEPSKYAGSKRYQKHFLGGVLAKSNDARFARTPTISIKSCTNTNSRSGFPRSGILTQPKLVTTRS